MTKVQDIKGDDLVDERDLIRSVFANRAGAELLDYWDQVFMHKCSFHPQNTPETTAYNEGLRAFVLAIHSLLKEN